MKRVQLHTDGSCLGNPGPGGWCYILVYGKHERVEKGSLMNTTNNVMELTAVINGLSNLTERCHVTIYSDSKYVLDGLSKWLPSWKKMGWKTSNKKTPANIDLWKKMDQQLSRHQIETVWVKGHSGDNYNERCDTVAREAAEDIKIRTKNEI